MRILRLRVWLVGGGKSESNPPRGRRVCAFDLRRAWRDQPLGPWHATEGDPESRCLTAAERGQKLDRALGRSPRIHPSRPPRTRPGRLAARIEGATMFLTRRSLL